MSLLLPDSSTIRELDDGELLEAITSGNTLAFEEFFDRHHWAARALAFRILRDDVQAEDVLQEAFLAVWRRSASFQASRGEPRAWFFSLVHHQAIDQVRRKRARGEVMPLSDELNGFPDPHAIQPLEGLIDTLQRNCIRDALANLPPAQREVLELAYFGGYTYREVAALTQVSFGTAKGRIRLGMQKLRTVLVDLAENDRS